MIFLTVGTQFPFDRLVMAVDTAVERGEVSEQIFAQVGESSYLPHNFEAVCSLEKPLYDKYIRQSSCVISHAGIGTIALALSISKPLLAMPRRRKYGEAVNDHQSAIAKKFEQLGHILAAYREEDLGVKISDLRFFVPQPRSSKSSIVVNRITQYLSYVDKSD